ncbi:hypothetical protein R6Z07M_010836 [Ovis aries]
MARGRPPAAHSSCASAVPRPRPKANWKRRRLGAGGTTPWAVSTEEKESYRMSAIQNLHSFDPFADASKGDDLLPAGTEDYIHIRIQQRNGRKTLTTVQGIADDYDKKKLVKAFKKKFACNGTVIEHPEYGEVIQLQGDQRKNICQFLVEIGLAKDDQLKELGTSLVSSEAGPGQQSGASHTTEVTNHVAWSGEESEARKDKMQRLCAHALILVLALAAFCEASWKPHSQLQDAPVAPGANKGQEPLRMDRLGLASHPRRQLGLQDPPHMVADLSKKQGPWVEEEEAAYGWMDFGRRSAEEGDQHP